MEFPVAAFERLCHPFDRIDNIEAFHQIQINAGGVADQAEYRLEFTDGNVNLQAQRLQPGNQLCSFFIRYTVF